MTNWRPIIEYDEMDPTDRPRFAVFYYPGANTGGKYKMSLQAWTHNEPTLGHFRATLWLPLDDPGQTIDDNYPFDAVAPIGE